MLMRTPSHTTLVFFARIVMPRSRSSAIRVHDAIDQRLVAPEDPALAEHRVDQRRLAVVDVRDDRDVTDVCPALRHEPATVTGGRRPVNRGFVPAPPSPMPSSRPIRIP
jgi:hypothetical protein